MLTANIATGYGTFQYAEDLASDFGGMVADINHDGALDVIGDSVHIRNGNGWLTYANGPGVGKLVDLDGDNDLDVLRGRYWVENVGGGRGWAQHELATVASGVVYVSSDVADFDSDGDLDIVLTRGNKVDWLENVNGNASAWTEHEITGQTIFDFLDTVAADMNNDGKMDIVISPITFHILWLEGRGDGSFEPYFREVGITADDGRVYTSAWSLNVGDFDADGRTDLFAVDGTNGETAIRWFTPKDDPTSRFRRTTVDRVRTADSETLSVDIDDDGNLELIVTNRSNDGLLVYERTSDFGFTEVQLGSDYIGHLIDSGDLDGDGDLDLVGNDFIFWNTGGDFHIETTDIAPTAIASNGEASVLRIEATHNGQDADDDIVLTSFSFMVDDGTGEVGSSPLDASRMASLFESWRIYLGDGIGGAGDLLSSARPSIKDGVVHVDLSAASLNLRGLRPGETRSYYLEVKMAATAHEFGNYRITNLTDLGILTGSDATATNPTGSVVANKDYSPNVSATLESAGNISFEMNTVMLNEGTYEPSAVVEVLRIDSTHTGLADGEVARLAFRIDEPASGGPLDSQTVNGLIENLRIVAEDNSEVVRIENLNVNNGVLLVDLPDGDSRLNLFNETRSFRVVIEVGSDATNQTIRGFSITHLTSDSNSERSTVELTSNDAPATLVSTPDQSATIFTGTEVDVVVTSSMTTPVTGQQVTYTVTVSNQHVTTGASGIELQGLLPNSLLNVVLVDLQTSGGATSSHSIGDSLSGTWTDILTLPQQSSVTYTLTGTLSELSSANRSMEPEFLLSQVSTTISNSLFDTNPDNNQDARADLVRLSSTGTGQFVDSGINVAGLDGNGAVRINELALGDIDGDGDVDAIVTRGASGSPGNATVIFNDGTGNYTESDQDFGYSNFTGAVLGDFDGDGDLDLYLATSIGISGETDDTDRVYLNDGNGVFTQTIQSLPYLTESVEVGDMDGDGDLDIVISGPNQSYTLRHHVAGIFAPRDSFGVLNNLEEMKLADVDGDGDLDVVGQKNNGLQVYLNDGNYRYIAGAQIASYSVMDFEVGDIDNDGDVDVLVSRESSVYLPGPGSVDRDLTLIQRSMNNGSGIFTTSYSGAWGSYLALELGDFDNDGDLDAFLVEEVYAGDDGSGTVYDDDAVAPISVSGRVWTNNGSGSFSESAQSLNYNVVPTSPYTSADFSVTAADINGDGSLDIVTGDFTAAKIWFSNVAPTLTVTNSTVAIVQNAIASNSGLVSDSAYDSLTLGASIGTVTNNGNGTWSWSYAETSNLATTTVTVTATDSSGSSTEVSFELVVGLAPVIAATNSSVTVDEGQTAINSGSFNDPDSALAPNLTASVGTVNDNGNGTWTWTLDTNDGPDQSQTVTITATDAQGLTSTATFAVVINNLAPVITADETTVTVNEGATAFMTGTISDAGKDEVTLLASIGTVTDNGDGTWNWLFDTNDGPDDSRTVTITATDSDGAVSQATFNLIVNNVGPSLNFDGSSLFLFEGQTALKSGTVSDVDGVASLTASQGTVVLNADGTWTWTDIASTSFDAPPQRVVLTATDQDGAVTTREFTLTVFNTPVIFHFDASDMTVNEGETATRTGTYDNPRNEPLYFWSNVGQFTDHGDGTFTWNWLATDGPATQGVNYSFSDDDDGSSGFFQVTVNNVAPAVAVNNATVTVAEGSAASNSGTVGDAGLDTVSLSASVGTVTNDGDGTWSWSFNTNDGPDQSQTVTITATDSDGAATSTSFALTVKNVAPTVSVSNASVSVNEGQTATNSGSFGDVGLDAVTVTASVGTVTSDGNGTWSWLFNTNDGPDQSQTVTITATDSDGAQTSTSFELTVENVAPTVSAANASASVNEGETAINSGSFGDVGLDAVNLTASVGTVTSHGDGTWSWSFDTNDGPDQSQTVTITATDSDGAETSTSFALNVKNVAPTVSASNATVSVDEGETAKNSGSFGDVGLDAVTLTASVGTVTSDGDDSWSWSFHTSEGFEDSQSVTITATDSDGATNSVSFELTVFDLPVAVTVPENSRAVANLATIVPTALDFRMFGQAPAGELGPGQTLSAGQFITSPNGTARLVMQGDGNLVVYLNGTATWASRTNNGTNTNTTTIEADGELVIRNGSGDIIYISDSGGNTRAYARLRVDDSGVPQIIRVDGEILWEGILNAYFGQGRHFAPDSMRPEFVLGADTDLFEIVNGNELQFIAPPDFELSTDADGDGVYEVSVLADDGNGNVIPKTFLVTVTDATEIPSVESVVIGDGTAQRSMLTSLTVTFDQEVTLGDGAFEVTDGGGNQVTLKVTSVNADGKTVSTITFPGLTGGSLRDGNYRLKVNSGRVRVGADQMESDHIDAFFRLFGDVDGDRDVDSLDYLAFRSTYRRTAVDNLFNSAFDADGDGDVDTADYLAFRRNYGRVLDQ